MYSVTMVHIAAWISVTMTEHLGFKLSCACSAREVSPSPFTGTSQHLLPASSAPAWSKRLQERSWSCWMKTHGGGDSLLHCEEGKERDRRATRRPNKSIYRKSLLLFKKSKNMLPQDLHLLFHGVLANKKFSPPTVVSQIMSHYTGYCTQI